MAGLARGIPGQLGDQPAAPMGAPAGGQIGGNLNFGSPAGMDFSGNPASLGQNYASAYQNALNLNQQNYGNILAGFQQTMGQQQQAQQGLQAGYGSLQQSVLGGIAGIGASQSQAIKDAYAQQSGAASQGLISRGLGNTTVQDSVQRGLQFDKQKADIALANQMAGLTAGYQSNLGLAGLNFGNQANMQNTALANQQLGWMNSVNAPYPNAGQYGQLAQQYGASQNMGRLTDALSAARSGGGGGANRGIGLGSYVPSGGGFTRANDYGGGATSGLAGVGGVGGGYSQLAIDQARANQIQTGGGMVATGTGGTADPNQMGPNVYGYDGLNGLLADWNQSGQYTGGGNGLAGLVGNPAAQGMGGGGDWGGGGSVYGNFGGYLDEE